MFVDIRSIERHADKLTVLYWNWHALMSWLGKGDGASKEFDGTDRGNCILATWVREALFPQLNIEGTVDTSRITVDEYGVVYYGRTEIVKALEWHRRLANMEYWATGNGKIDARKALAMLRMATYP